MAGSRENRSDQDLIARIQGGDTEAFATFVRRHQEATFSLLLGILRDPGQAEDLTEQTFLRAYTFLDRQRSPRDVGFWLRKLAVNLALTRLRGEADAAVPSLARRVPGPPVTNAIDQLAPRAPVDSVPNTPGPPTPLAPAHPVPNAPGPPTPLHRAILALRAVSELHYGEIAPVVGLPQETVAERLRQARASLERTNGAAAEPVGCDEEDAWLDAYVDDELPARGRRRVSRHLELCAACRLRVKGITARDQALRLEISRRRPSPGFFERLPDALAARAELADLRSRWQPHSRQRWWSRIFGS